MKRDDSGPGLAAEFQPRGEEHGKFRGSAPRDSASSLDIISGTASRSNHAMASERRDHNSWQSVLPEAD
jgi:hypothetical protein